MEGIHRYPKLPMVGWLGDIYDGWCLLYYPNSTSFMVRKDLSFEYPPMEFLDCLSFRRLCEVFYPFELYICSREQ
jgi:hypothetical protein